VALPPHPTLVCFDLGGVLIRICRSWAESCAAAEVELREAEHFAAEATVRARRSLADRYQLGQISVDEYLQSTHELIRGLYSLAELGRVHAAVLRGEYPGVSELVARLNAMPGVATACLSNTNHAHWQQLLADPGTPVMHALGARLASHLLGCAKPGVQIYQRAEQELGRSGAEILFFDDLADNVAAAERAGWRAVLIDPHGDTAAQMRQALASAGLELT
jgi:putative hydrolase of the HAD superfamily